MPKSGGGAAAPGGRPFSNRDQNNCRSKCLNANVVPLRPREVISSRNGVHGVSRGGGFHSATRSGLHGVSLEGDSLAATADGLPGVSSIPAIQSASTYAVNGVPFQSDSLVGTAGGFHGVPGDAGMQYILNRGFHGVPVSGSVDWSGVRSDVKGSRSVPILVPHYQRPVVQFPQIVQQFPNNLYVDHGNIAGNVQLYSGVYTPNNTYTTGLDRGNFIVGNPKAQFEVPYLNGHNLYPEEIDLDGALIQKMFQGEVDFVQKAVDALVRLYTEMDAKMYLKWNEKRWRHFLPTTFAVWALSENRREPTMQVEDLFLGANIKYKVEDCRLIMVPVLVHWHWCLYVWDFKREILVVLDPRGRARTEEIMKEKHNKTITLMHSAMQECHKRFLNSNNHYMEDWGMEYATVNAGNEESMHSGLHTMFCARYFDGEILTRILTKEACQLQRINLMYQLLKMDENVGDAPQEIVDAINY